MSFAGNFIGVTTDPDRFFAKHADDIRLRQTVVLVVLVGILNLFPSLLMSRRLLQSQLDGEIAHQMFLLGQGFGAILSVITTFVVWLLITAVLHGLSGYLGASEGEFRRTFKYVGWGFLPKIFASLVTLGATWYALQRIPPSVSAQQLQAALQGFTIVKLSTGVGILILVWQGLIWTFAVHHSRGLTVKQSGLVAAFPTVGLIMLSLAGLF